MKGWATRGQQQQAPVRRPRDAAENPSRTLVTLCSFQRSWWSLHWWGLGGLCTLHWWGLGGRCTLHWWGLGGLRTLCWRGLGSGSVCALPRLHTGPHKLFFLAGSLGVVVMPHLESLSWQNLKLSVLQDPGPPWATHQRNGPLVTAPNMRPQIWLRYGLGTMSSTSYSNGAPCSVRQSRTCCSMSRRWPLNWQCAHSNRRPSSARPEVLMASSLQPPVKEGNKSLFRQWLWYLNMFIVSFFLFLLCPSWRGCPGPPSFSTARYIHRRKGWLVATWSLGEVITWRAFFSAARAHGSMSNPS